MSVTARLTQLLATENPHSGPLASLRAQGYHYDGHQSDGKISTHKLSYKSKRTPEHNAQLINAMKRHGFAHEKIDGGHKFTRPDAHVTVKSKVGATRVEYKHRTIAG